MKLISTFLIALSLGCGSSRAQSTRVFVSPGICMGYIFGQGGDGYFGLEISATRWPIDRFFYGLAAKFDLWGASSRKFHLAAEVGTSFMGISFGPTWASRESLLTSGITATVWTGGGIMPYYAHSWFSDGGNLGELGVYLKYPVQLAGEKFGWTN